MKTILVTGGAGFIGSNLVRYLYDKYPDYRILVVDALTYAGSVQNTPEGAFGSNRYEFWYGDVRNGELMNALVSQADVVIHMAAESHVTRSIYDNRLFFETDVIGTQVVSNAVVKHAKTVERFIHISTSEVYGSALQEKMDEEHPLNPMSPYAAAKCGADRLVYSYWQTYNIPAMIIRPFNNFGPNQHLEKVVPRFITSTILGEPMTVHGDGSASRDWLFVEDHCEALDLAIHTDINRLVGQVINLGTGEHRSVAEIAEAVNEVAMECSKELVTVAGGRRKDDFAQHAGGGSRAIGTTKIEFIGDRPGQVFRHTCDASKAKRLLGWEPRTDFRDGLKKTMVWYQENQSWWQPQMWMRHIPIISASGKREMH
ncbi:MAG: GDP-mannose 4,6-dehydratase [Candidatus Melainabacteria bacterium]|nr:GDP-mannose 4,6-dehydratase [Candidatus Melainabacteria bacterium]